MKVLRFSGFCITLCLLCVALASCGRETRRGISTADLENSSPFVAKVDRVYVGDYADSNLVMKKVVLIGLEIKGGEKITLGDSGTNVDLLLGFAHTLTNGMSYRFPDVWLDYKQGVAVKGSEGTNGVSQAR